MLVVAELVATVVHVVLNAVYLHESILQYCLERLELINKICKFTLFSYVDFPDAYFSVPLSENSLKHNPVVASVSGMNYNFRYLRMPQGLKPATACFINLYVRTDTTKLSLIGRLGVGIWGNLEIANN